MAKTLARIVAVLVLVLAASVGGAWYVYAGKAVTTIEQLVAASTNLEMAYGGHTKITYERIERTAFPATGARLINPAFEISIPGDAATARPAVTRRMKLNGSTDIVIDYLRNRFLLASNGGGTMNIQIGDEKFAGTWDTSSMSMMAKAKNREAFAQWGTLTFKDKEALATAVRNTAEFTMNAAPMSLKDSTSNAVIFAHQGISSHIVNRTTTEKAKLDIAFSLKGSEVSKEYGEMVGRFQQALQTAAPGAVEQTDWVSRAGKLDADLDVSLDIPDMPRGAPMPNGSVIVRKFAMKNDFYTVDMPTEIILTEAQGERKASVRLNWKMEVSQAGNEELRRSSTPLKNVIPMMNGNASTNAANIDQEALDQKIIAALPSFAQTGPITLAVDLEASVPSPAGAGKPEPSNEESVTVRNFSFDHKRWGIEAKGKAARQPQKPPLVDFTLNLKRGDAMTADIFTTANQVQDILNFVAPERPQWDISPTMHERVNALLAEIGKKDSASGDITFGISAATTGDVRINEKPVSEVMMKVMALAAPTDTAPQNQAPAAGTPTH